MKKTQSSSDEKVEAFDMSFPDFNPNPVLEINENFELVYSNRAALEIKDQVLEFLRIDYKGQQNETVELRLKDKFFKVDIVKVREKNNIHLYLTDITSFKQISKEHQRIDKLFSELISLSPMDIAIFNDKHHYLYLNGKGVKDNPIREWLIGKDDFEYCLFRNKPISIAERRREAFSKCLQNGVGSDLIEEFDTPSGMQFIRRFYQPVKGLDDTTYVIGYAVDVTAQVENARRAHESFIQTIENNVNYASILDSYSHEIRQPLKSMEVLIETLIEESKEFSPNEQMVLEKMQSLWIQFTNRFEDLSQKLSSQIKPISQSIDSVNLKAIALQLQENIQSKHKEVINIQAPKGGDVNCTVFIVEKIVDDLVLLFTPHKENEEMRIEIEAENISVIQIKFIGIVPPGFRDKFSHTETPISRVNLSSLKLTGIYFFSIIMQISFYVTVNENDTIFKFNFSKLQNQL